MAASSVVSVVQWIGPLLIQEARSLYNVEEQVRGLIDELEFMQQYLQDADARQEENIKVSVRQIRKLAYETEDVIDTYILKVRQSNGNWLGKFSGFLYNLPRVYLVNERIQVIHTSLKQVKDELNGFGLRRDTELGFSTRPRQPSYSYDDIDGEFVVGLEKDLPKLLEVLTSEGKAHENTISIVGMGGSGKTTLARKLFNHPYIRECFSCTAWVSVSQAWNTLHVLSEILRAVGGPEGTLANSSMRVPEYIDKLRNVLKNKSYLVVLDDVWKREALEEILPALPHGNVHGGSKIIITTRNRDIFQFQKLQQNMYIYEPPPLSNEEGWDLFHKIALSHSRHSNEVSFENLGKEMLEKCDGLPLAIVALAGILNVKDSIAEWYRVNKAVRSRLIDGTGTHMFGKVGHMLALSYDDLPYYLKPCFLYLSLFPEDFEIPAGTLTRMWIAEGLVSTPGDMSVEDAAMQHLEELSHRFMVQVVRTNFKGVIKVVSLHDLLRDVGLKKAKETSFLQICAPVSEPGCSDMSAFALQPRRAALHSSTSLPIEISYLRSLVLLTRSSTSKSCHIDKETLDIMIVPQRYKLLRLLTLRGIRTVDGSLPKQIGSLLHLRYLELRATNITELPSSIGKLKYLLVLDYRDVVSEHEVPIIKIPNVLWKLVLLRHLFLPINCPWSVQELKLSTILSLQTLWGVKQDGAGQWLSTEISELTSTVNKLKIVVSNEDELKAVFSSPSLMSDRLQTFHCELRDGLVLSKEEPLCRRQRLHKLILIGEVRMELSQILPANLVTLRLKDSVLKDDNPMAVLGALCHLKLLQLHNALSVDTLVCNPGSFPQLEELYLESLVSLEMWKIDKGAMSCLKKLEITRCWHLKQLPQNLEFVTTLQQFDFFEIPASFRKEAAEYGWSPSKLRLPSNYGAIIRRSDSPVDTSSIRKLHEQLTAGIYLDNKSQKYWVAKRDDFYYNCFMVYATNLQPDRPDIRGEPTLMLRNFKKIEEGVSVTTVELKFPDVHVNGAINTADLSSYVTYEIIWVVMFEGFDYKNPFRVDELEMDIEFNSIFVHTNLVYQHHDEHCSSMAQHREFYYQTTPINQWEQVPGGEFEIDPTNNDDNSMIRVYLYYTQRDTSTRLVVKGFIVQPKP